MLLRTDYSIIVSTERGKKNPTKIILKNGNEFIIPTGRVAIWSGKYLHAGAAYSVRNRRLFIAVTSISSPHKLKNVEQVVYN